MFKKNSLLLKIIALHTLAGIITIGGVLTYSLNAFRTKLLNSELKSIDTQIAFQKEKIEFSMGEIHNFMKFLENNPTIQKFANLSSISTPSQETIDQIEILHSEVEQIFDSKIAATNGLYNQLRYIDENGQEIIRVENNQQRIKFTQSKDLQNKKDRPYYQKTKEIPKGSIYISPTELNKEGSPPKVSKPITPVKRFSVPIYDSFDESFRGIVIANIDVNLLLKKSILLTNSKFNFYVLNNDGSYIMHPESKKNWGGKTDLNTGYTIYSEHPELAPQLLKSKATRILTDSSYYSTFQITPPNGDQSTKWVILGNQQLSAIFKPVDNVIFHMSLLATAASLLLLLFSILLIRKLLQPLVQLNSAAQEISHGNFNVTLPIQSNDEIGEVSKGFNEMTKELQSLYQSLEEQVDKKTRKLTSKLKDLTNARSAMTNVLEDISEDKQQMELILSSVGDGVFVLDNALNILLVNKTAAKLSGHSIDKAIGEPCAKVFKFINSKTKRGCQKIFASTLQLKTIQQNETLTLVRKNREKIPISMTVAPLTNTKGTLMGLVVAFRDITKNKEIDRAKTEFVSLASHQLRTPLTAMRLFCEMLLTDNKLRVNKAQKKYLKNVYTSTLRMIDLVSDLLNVSRLETGHMAINPVPTNLIDLVKTVIVETAALSKKRNVKINLIEPKQPLPDIPLDPSLTHEVLVSLISNALRYTPHDGDDVEISITTTQDEYIVSVKDHGIGIPKNSQSSMFQKFFRADNAVTHESDGTGLGLYIAKKIIDTSGGRIWFESKKGKGTTFSFSIPITGMKPNSGSKSIAHS